MFGIQYETWENVCSMYFNVKKGSLSAYLQWFPFSKLSSEDKEYISSEEFFYRYINHGSFVIFETAMQQTDNFLLKSDGSFRDSSLIAPVLYLVLQCIGKEISVHYSSQRPQDIAVYYAGNYGLDRPSYKQDYDDFFKDINSCIEDYPYYIKTDVTNFFSSIDIDRLFRQIDEVGNNETVIFPQARLRLYKEFIQYCGNGKFPLVENSMASSFLSTVIYLDYIDKRLHGFISEKLPMVDSFRMIRYVDDMYILIDSQKSIRDIRRAYNSIRNEYSSLLKEFGLALNSKKCCLEKSVTINYQLKKSLYDEEYNGMKGNIEDHFEGSLENFVWSLSTELETEVIDIVKYNQILEENFSSEDIEFTPSEVFNYYIYENNAEINKIRVVNGIIKLVSCNLEVIYLDPRRLTTLIIKSGNGKSIKAFLNQLFQRDRSEVWNSYDTSIAVSYLLQRKFKHQDLLSILQKRSKRTYSYYYYNCSMSFLNCLRHEPLNKLIDVIGNDEVAYYLYFSFLCEIKRKNFLAAHSYFKNFFDRITADIAFALNIDDKKKKKKPSYNSYYKADQLKYFYREIDGSDVIIDKAHELRNSNPINHSSAELLYLNNTTEEIKESIRSLFQLLIDFVSKHST